MSVSQLLQDLLKQPFFEQCEQHRVYGTCNSEVSTYCIDCKLCLCFHCLSKRSVHNSHDKIRVQRYTSLRYLTTADVRRFGLIDISDVQVYEHGGGERVLLHPRKNLVIYENKTYKNTCKNCHSAIVVIDDSKKYCSLGCKVQNINEMNASSNTGTGSSVQTGSSSVRTRSPIQTRSLVQMRSSVHTGSSVQTGSSAQTGSSTQTESSVQREENVESTSSASKRRRMFY